MAENNERDERVAGYLSQPCAWAVLPETMALISAVTRGELSVDAAVAAAAARGSHRAELRTAPPAAEETGAALQVITLRGLITPRGTWFDEMCGNGGGGLVGFQAVFNEAVASSDVGAILIDIDSPGGLTDLVAETGEIIRAARGTKPIVAIANTLAASAAYWLASQADELVVTPSGFAGSIGVYVVHQDLSGLYAQEGVVNTLVSAGKRKVEANPYQPLTDQARAGIQETVDDIYALFADAVAAGRGVSAEAVRAGFGEGRVLTAKRAVAAGLADRVEDVDATVARMLRGESAIPTGTAGASAMLAAEEPPKPEPEPDPAIDIEHDQQGPEDAPAPDEDPDDALEGAAAASAAAAREHRRRLAALLG